MCKGFSQCNWVWNSQGSVTKDQQRAIMDIPHMRNKFKQNHTSENWYKFKTLSSKCANLLKKTKKKKKKKKNFVKTNVKNNRSRN